jgi:hypothetical protein
MNRYRIEANFPSLKAHEAYQVIEVQASNWYQALRRGAVTLRALPILKKRHITALSLTVSLAGKVMDSHPADEQPEDLQERLYPTEDEGGT